MKKKPLDVQQISLRISYKNPNNGIPVIYSDVNINDKIISLKSRAGKYQVGVNMKILMKALEDRKLPEGTIIRFDVSYPVKK